MDGRFSPYYDHGPHLVAWLIFAVLLALLVVLVVAALARLGRGQPPAALLSRARPAAADEPLEVLRLRYARGELTRDEFLQASADLGGPPPPG